MQQRKWEVHLIRNGEDRLGNPTFSYARNAEEVGRYRRKSIGEGLLRHIQRIGLREELLESGLSIKMSLKRIGEGSQRLRLVCKGDDFVSHQVDHVFCSDHPEETGVIRFFSFNCRDSIPATIWIQVSELDQMILACSLGGELDGSLPKKQTSIDEFGCIGLERAEDWCKEREEANDKGEECLLDILEKERESASSEFPEFVLPGPMN
jgi:hypothetical protein